MAAEIVRGRHLRCDHCGRAVHETVHTRGGYQVDFYSMYTGDVESCSISTDEGERTLTFQKLVRGEEVATCVECYRDPEVRHGLEARFRPERAEQGVEA